LNFKRHNFAFKLRAKSEPKFIKSISQAGGRRCDYGFASFIKKLLRLKRLEQKAMQTFLAGAHD
jgi:hypothetical protein